MSTLELERPVAHVRPASSRQKMLHGRICEILDRAQMRRHTQSQAERSVSIMIAVEFGDVKVVDDFEISDSGEGGFDVWHMYVQLANGMSVSVMHDM